MSNAVSFVMSEGDILKEYREAKFPREQIKILADQNLVTPKVMREFILSKIGEAPAFRTTKRLPGCFCWTETNVEAVRRLAAQKKTDSEIAERIGVSVSSVRNARYAYGIPIGKYEERKRA